MNALDWKSLVVGVLVGACLCTVLFLVLEKQGARYQMVMYGRSDCYLVDQNTGTIYAEVPGEVEGWYKLRDGPTGREVPLR